MQNTSTESKQTEVARCCTQLSLTSFEMVEEDNILFWEGDMYPNLGLWSESKNPAPHSETMPPAKEVSLEAVAPIELVTATHTQIAKPSTPEAAPSDAIQDTKLAEQQRAVSTIGTTETTVKDPIIRRSLYRQVTPGTQTETVSDLSK